MIQRIQQWLRRYNGELPIEVRFKGSNRRFKATLLDADGVGVLVRRDGILVIPWAAVGHFEILGDEYPDAPPVE